MYYLTVRPEELVNSQVVESSRVEFKKTWNDRICESVIHSICAFANDLLNLGGGYIVLGIEEKDGKPVLPPSGLNDKNLDQIQKEIQGQCNRIEPVYIPVIQPVTFQGKQILIIRVPGGDNRPYKAPEGKGDKKTDKFFYIRSGSMTMKAAGNILTDLIAMTAKIPFDDRRYSSPEITTDVISPSLVRNFLSDIHSDMVAPGVDIPDNEILRNMNISVRINSHEVPRNVALLFFTNSPDQYLPGAKMEIAQFGDDAGGDLIEEKYLKGPIHHQIRQSLDYLNSLSSTMVRKVSGVAEVNRTVAFPYEAMEEAIVNAYYHRGYEGSPHPVIVYLYPDRMEITSYPGPVPGMKMDYLQPGKSIPPLPNRNRRIGEFLKELRLAEGRGTGIPKIFRKMKENNSPVPIFDFDEERTYFRVILPAHPQYIVLHALTESARLWATGDRKRAVANLTEAYERVPGSGELAAQIIEYSVSYDDLQFAETFFQKARQNPFQTSRHLPFLAMAKAYVDKKMNKEAEETLKETPLPSGTDEMLEMAILNKRVGGYREAHRLFESCYLQSMNDPRALQEFAQTKMKIAGTTKNKKVRDKMNREALEMLHRAVQLSDDNIRRKAWCLFDIARVHHWLHNPESEVIAAYNKAIELLPREVQFQRWFREK